MKILTNALLVAFFAYVGLLVTACPERTSIGDIEANPGKYHNKEIAIAGRVVDSYGVSIPGTGYGVGGYKIDDGTGSIWVLVTEGTVPQKGVEVGVKGVVGTGISVKGRNYGLGIYEKDRRVRKR